MSCRALGPPVELPISRSSAWGEVLRPKPPVEAGFAAAWDRAGAAVGVVG